MATGTELGKAYVQIMPSAEGIQGKINMLLNDGAEDAGDKAGKTIGSKLKAALIASGIGTALVKVVSAAVSEGGELQQSLGGVETLFKDSADKVKEYANQAFQTTGLSANDYMQNVTSFSASLLQSLGGDTSKAADIANMAMVDMADNSNKMGTSMESIQTAYQGFAKQNYTMLDNLKLGYGGTKTEMERLLTDATKLTGVTYDISNLSDVYNAIHAIQGQMGITGTTAKEASQTFSGSLSAMKAAAQNLLGNLSLGEDITPALNDLTGTVITFANNLIPMITSVVSQLPTALVQMVISLAPTLISSGLTMVSSIITGIAQALPELIPQALNMVMLVAQSLVENVPLLVTAAIALVEGLSTGIINAIPGLLLLLPGLIQSMIDTLLQQIPLLIDCGIQLLTSIVTNLPQIIDQIVRVLPLIIDSIVTALLDNLPALIDCGVQLFIALITNLPQIISTLVESMPEIIDSLVKALGDGVSDFVDVGWNMLCGLGDGIANAVGNVISKAIEACEKVLNSVKNFFGIHSPSKVMAGIGMYLDEGLANGINDNTKPVTDAMRDITDLTTGSLQSEIAVNATSASSIPTGSASYTNLGGVQITVNAKDGQSAKEIAQEVSNILSDQAKQESAVFA